jgi:N-acetylglutamate synthase-like GNAT family acetyltransferase
LEEGVAYFILEAEGHPCGCAALEQATPETCYLERLAVYPRQRRRGFGQALAAAVIREAELRGAQYLEIGIIAEQAELGEWYRKLGFLEHKTATFGHLPFTVRFMRLRLKAGRQSR